MFDLILTCHVSSYWVARAFRLYAYSNYTWTACVDRRGRVNLRYIQLLVGFDRSAFGLTSGSTCILLDLAEERLLGSHLGPIRASLREVNAQDVI